MKTWNNKRRWQEKEAKRNINCTGLESVSNFFEFISIWSVSLIKGLAKERRHQLLLCANYICYSCEFWLLHASHLSLVWFAYCACDRWQDFGHASNGNWKCVTVMSLIWQTPTQKPLKLCSHQPCPNATFLCRTLSPSWPCSHAIGPGTLREHKHKGMEKIIIVKNK